MTKGITLATAKAVAAGNSCRQEDIIATANLSRRAIADMLHSCKVHGRQMLGLGSGGNSVTAAAVPINPLQLIKQILQQDQQLVSQTPPQQGCLRRFYI